LSVAKSSFLFALGTFLSRLTGVLRESVLAGVFGANALLDAFIIANRIPNLLRELLAEGALGSSFTKVYATLKEQDSQRAHRFLVQSFQFFSLIIGILCLVGIVFAPELVKLMTLFSPETEKHAQFIHDTVGLTRLLFPFIAFMTLGAIASGVLHQKGRFFTSAISSVALNIGYIIGALFFARLLEKHGSSWIESSIADRSLTGLALGVLLGGLLQTLIQFWGMKTKLQTKGLVGRFPWSPDIKKVCKLMGPMVIAGSAGQINVLVNTNFATSLQEGAVTWLNFSFRLLQLPIGIFAVGVGIISLPSLTRVITKKGSPFQVAEKLEEALFLVTWLVAPCLCFLLINSLPVTQLLYQHGKFTSFDSISTADALFFYSFSLIAYGLLKVLTSYYYAAERTQYAMKVSLFSILINLLANLFFVSHLGHKGLALSTSCTLTLNALFLLWGLRKDKLKWSVAKIGKSIFLLSSAFLISFTLQKLIAPLLENAIFVTKLELKWRACFVLSTNGCLVASIFVLFWFLDTKQVRK
jgi:putative peptidoglycan lipid II flippase